MTDFNIEIKNIEIEDSTAKVNVIVSYTDEIGKRIDNSDSLILLNESIWKFTSLGLIENPFFSLLYKVLKEGDNPNIEGYTIIQPIINDNTFHQVPLMTPQGQPAIWELNYGLTETVFNNQLFAANQGINWAGWYWGPDPYNQYLKIALLLDNGWRRIVFSKDNLDGAINLYDYGRWPGNQEFQSPRSIDINEFGEVLIADESAKCIYKLNYNLSSNTITASAQPVFISNPALISKPVSVDYYSGTTYNNRSDDRIVIADQGLDCISIFDGSGNFINKITHFRVSGHGYVQIKEPRSAVIYGFDNPPYRIAFIDGGSNSLVCGWINESSNYFIPFTDPAKFSGFSKLYDIGVDGCYNLLVTDLFGQLVHKFSKSGKYSCSYNKDQQIMNPFYASNVVDNCDFYSHALHFYIGGAWGRDNGITEYLPGADVLNLNHGNFNTYYRFNFFPTDEIEYQVRLLRVSNNQVINIWPSQGFNTAYTSTIAAVFKDKDASLINGVQYKWLIYYRPRYDVFYGQYQVGWKVKEGPTFTHSVVAPVISYLSQSPNPLYRGQSGSMYCNLSQGASNLNFKWSIEFSQIGFSISTNDTEQRLNIYYSHSTDAIDKTIIQDSKENSIPTDDYNNTKLKCKVWNSLGSDSAYVFVNLSNTYHGCPFVYTWDGQEWIEDNNILPQSQDPEILGQDVTDYYQLFTKPVLEDDKYYLAIGEFEEEKSYLDQLKLLIIDHPDETFVTVDDVGQVIQFAKPAYFASALLDSTDVIKQLYELDNTYVEAAEGDTLYLTFDDVNGSAEPWVLIVGQSYPLYKDKITGKVLGGDKESFSSFRLRRNPTFNWVLVPTTGSSSLDVEIAWEQDA